MKNLEVYKNGNVKSGNSADITILPGEKYLILLKLKNVANKET